MGFNSGFKGFKSNAVWRIFVTKREVANRNLEKAA
jgi:hypothetical protein